MKRLNRTDWWNEISRAEQNSINLGLEDIKAGKVKPHSEARKLYKHLLSTNLKPINSSKTK